MIKAILFDLDGTLIDSPKLIMKSFEESLLEHNNYQPTELEMTSILGSTLTLAFNKYANDEDHLKRLINTFIKISNENNLIMLNPYKNASNVIQYLRDQKYLVGIVTSNNKQNVLSILKNHDMDHLFDCIITNEDSKIHKPNAEPIRLALNKLGVLPNEAIYIGDHENDIIAGNNAKTKTGLMGYSHRLNQAKEQKPTYIFTDLNHIKEIF